MNISGNLLPVTDLEVFQRERGIKVYKQKKKIFIII